MRSLVALCAFVLILAQTPALSEEERVYVGPPLAGGDVCAFTRRSVDVVSQWPRWVIVRVTRPLDASVDTLGVRPCRIGAQLRIDGPPPEFEARVLNST